MNVTLSPAATPSLLPALFTLAGVGLSMPVLGCSGSVVVGGDGGVIVAVIVVLFVVVTVVVAAIVV